MAGVRVPDVTLVRRDVEVSTDDQRLVGRSRPFDPFREMREPCQLCGVGWTVERATVRCIEADHTNPSTNGRHHSRFREGLYIVERGACGSRLTEVRDDVFQPLPTRDRDTVPSTLTMMRESIPQLFERLVRRIGVLK